MIVCKTTISIRGSEKRLLDTHDETNPKGRSAETSCATGIFTKRKSTIVSDTFVSKLSCLFGGTSAPVYEHLGNAAATASVVYRRLTAAGLKIKEMYAITHDRDHRKMWDDYLNDYLSLPSGAHIHILIKFEDKDGATLETIASIVGIAPEYIETPKTGRYAYDNMLSYLCHRYTRMSLTGECLIFMWSQQSD